MSHQIQAILIHKNINDGNHITKSKAKQYIKSLGIIPIKQVHETKNYYRFRLMDPKQFKGFVTRKQNDIVSFVVGYY